MENEVKIVRFKDGLDVICFFDIDCIPLVDFQELIENICKSGKILANVQRWHSTIYCKHR